MIQVSDDPGLLVSLWMSKNLITCYVCTHLSWTLKDQPLYSIKDDIIILNKQGQLSALRCISESVYWGFGSGCASTWVFWEREIGGWQQHTSVPLVSSMNLLLTVTRASWGQAWNQSTAVQLTRAGNFRALLLSVWPTGEKHKMICGDTGAGQNQEGDEWAKNHTETLDNEKRSAANRDIKAAWSTTVESNINLPANQSTQDPVGRTCRNTAVCFP